ncbi:MAG: ribosome biogenesis GTP-binding protein YihA/YsxC [Cytophagales bacterium]
MIANFTGNNFLKVLMLINSADFITSNTNFEKCPPPIKPEYDFIGRSNVGKSSLINCLVQKKDLAKTSAKPGKTQTINHFLINEKWYIVDLPGFGYASVSKTKKASFSIMIEDYLLKRENLMCVFVLIDSRLEPQAIDLDFIDWLGRKGIAFVISFTKVDKKGMVLAQKTIDFYKQTLMQTWEELPQIFITSAEKGLGRDEILAFIGETNKTFEKPDSKSLSKPK